MKAELLVAKAKDIAKNYKTLYVMGCFGAPLNANNRKRYTQNHDYNKQAVRTAMINKATSNTFGFDCVNLIKGILWGWSGDVNKTYGGSVYRANGVADESANGFFANRCKASTDWSDIVPGEAVWTDGHIGIYVGDGLAVECTPAWKNCVQVTAVGNIGKKSGYPTRTWKKHGKISYIDYSTVKTDKQEVEIKQEVKPAGLKYKLNDLIEFTGNTQYLNSSSAGKAVGAKPCKARITMVSEGKTHPYHCVAVNSKGVYGWVNEADIKPVDTIKKGCKVKVLEPITYNGKPFKAFYSEYDVLQVSGNRVVIGKGTVVTAAVHKENLKVIQ